MKIRTDFVTNSSSSNYIVSFNATIGEILYSHGNPIDLNGFIKKAIDLLKENDGYVYFLPEDDIKEKIKSLKEMSSLPSLNEEELDLLFSCYGIQIQKDGNRTTLGQFTSMHNDFEEGMSPLLREIIMSTLFETRISIECERKDGV